MRSHFGVPLLLLLLLACSADRGEPPASLKSAETLSKDAEALLGHYYSGDGLGRNVSFTLSADGSFTGSWHGCMGNYGEAKGTWRRSNGHVLFSPSSETGMMVGHLIDLEVKKNGDNYILVPTSAPERKFFDKFGPLRSSCFHNTDKTPIGSIPR